MHFVNWLRNSWLRHSIVPEDETDEGDPEDSDTPLEQKYDYLTPVPFSREVAQFADRIGREGQNFGQDELQDALAEYSFVQDRLSFWLAYYKKPTDMQVYIIDAALTLYQEAVNAGIVPVGEKQADTPRSWRLPPPERLRSMKNIYAAAKSQPYRSTLRAP